MVVAALERGQLKQPRLDLPASVVMVVRIAVVRNTGPVAVVVVVVRIAMVRNTGPVAVVVVLLPRAKAPAARAKAVAVVVVVSKAPARAKAVAVVVVVLLEGAARTMPSAARPCQSAPAGRVKVPQAAGWSRCSERSCRSPQTRGSR